MGCTYTELSEFVKNKKGYISIKNNHRKCFLWSKLASFHPANDTDVDGLSKYKPYENKLNFKGITNFPIDIQDIYKAKTNIALLFFI